MGAITCVCHSCGVTFEAKRSDAKTCSKACRNRKSLKGLSSASDAPLPSTLRKRMERDSLNQALMERLYTMPVDARLGYVEDVLQVARSGASRLLIDVLTDPLYLKFNPERRHHYWRGSPWVYCTFPQAVNRYCFMSPWRADVRRVIGAVSAGGPMAEPRTGEEVDDGQVQAKGWRQNRFGRKLFRSTVEAAECCSATSFQL